MNVRIGNGVAVHYASTGKASDGSKIYYGGRCNNDAWGRGGQRAKITVTTDAVTCKKCLKISPAQDLTPTQDTTSVVPNNSDNTEVTEMRTYAEYLNTMTVKTLNAIAKEMQLKGYSKLRKAELVTLIDNAVAGTVEDAVSRDADLYPVIAEVKPVVCMYCGARFANVQTSIEHIEAHTAEETDALFAEIFDSAPLNREIIDARSLDLITLVPTVSLVKAPQKPAKRTIIAPAVIATPDDNEESTEELTAAYVQMRLTLNTLATSTTRANLIKRVRGISAILKARGVKPARM